MMKEYLCSMVKSLMRLGSVMKSRLKSFVGSLTADKVRSLFGLILLVEIALLLHRFTTCSWNIADLLMYTSTVLLLQLLLL